MTVRSAETILDGILPMLSQREGNYDHPAANFEAIAKVWTVLLQNSKLLPMDVSLSALDVARLMAALKLVRDTYKYQDDNWIDLIGYGVCGMRVNDFYTQADAE